MTNDTTTDAGVEPIEAALLQFIRDEFLWGDDARELRVDSPLLELGVIDSLRTALLLAHIRDTYGAYVSPIKVNARDFRDVRAIAALVHAELPAAHDKERP